MTLPAPIIIDPHSVTSLRWGVIGPGDIADTWVGSVQKHTAQRVHAVASRTPGKAEAFAAKFGIAHVEASYGALVAREDIDAIYISSYPIDHFDHAMLAITAHKHVLIEKPITLQADQAKELLAAAKAEGVFSMEAMWTRYLPQSSILQQLLAEGSLGEPELFLAQFCTDNSGFERLWTHGGGGILRDMGVYPFAMAQQFLGNPTAVHAQGRVRADGREEEITVAMEYASGARAHLVVSGIASLPQVAGCSMEKAQVHLNAPFFVPSGITVASKDFYPTEETWLDTTPVQGHEALSYQATAFAHFVDQGLSESPVHTHADTVATIAVMEDVMKQIGAIDA
jgi:predicted dehydrogenase